jgi:hypothetical protein
MKLTPSSPNVVNMHETVTCEQEAKLLALKYPNVPQQEVEGPYQSRLHIASKTKELTLLDSGLPWLLP